MIFDKAYNLENRRDFLNYLRVKLFQDNLKENIKPISIDRKTIFFEESSCFELGKITLDKEISIFEIKQKSKNDPRITLTRDAFKIMESLGVQNALIVFYSADSSSWRLSLLTLKKTWGETETSNPKRYSFLLGVGEKTRTPEKYLNKTITDFKDLVSRFDVEVVRKEFFNDYLTLYIRLYSEISKEPELVKLQNQKKLELVSFTKNLLGKIIFLYFIQKKGWLGVEKGGNWGDGKKDFMRWLCENRTQITFEKTGNFYNDCLEHLFYDGLNSPSRIDNDDYDLNFKCRIPYLNGGLFKSDYDFEKFESKISNDIFSNTEKNGILDTFDLYNFTIDEDDLYDSDIAIDPEMLGRIFEKMISISPENIDEIVKIYESKKKIEIDKELNKKFGAFYTPREIVHYMTKESLVAYLLNNLKGKKEENEEKIRILFDLKEKFLVTKADIIEEIFDKLASIIEEVDLLLKKVKILDPAIGSGAFPMGILHEISTIRYYIYGTFYKTFGMNNDEFKNEQGKISMYKIKRDIIGSNIYGVDISAGAIDIARLRFWLSLVVDEETPEPLPNFEFKFVCANTLIPLAEEKEQSSLKLGGVKEINVETLRKYMVSYYNANGNKDKEEAKARIEKFLGIGKNLVMDMYNTKSERTKQLETYEPFNSNHSAEFFDPSLMMGNSKFDIVIGNPPYVSVKGIEKIEKEKFQKLYESGNGRFNLFNLFIEKGIKSLSKGGILSFIIPDGICSHTEYRHNRKFIIDNSNIIYINTFGKQVFDNASVDTIVLCLQKTDNKINNIKILNDLNETGNYINQNSILELPDLLFPVNLTKTNTSIILKGLNIDTKFQDFLEIQQGIIYSGQAKEEVFSNEKVNESYKKVLDGRDILKWKNNYSEKLENKYICYSNKLHRAREERIYLSDKIIFPRRSSTIAGTIDKEQFYALNTVYIGLLKNDILKLEYILAILNSKFNNFFYGNLFLGWQITIPALDFLPIPKLSEEKQKPFIEKVDKILEITKQPFYDPKNPPKEQKDLEDEIDKMVYELYGLSEEEVRVVEDSLK
ncbi:MAG: TaqI-like C-terminal specificity domain-containing protein [Candidatus Gracilibacteria bacterium]|nr:TaqI-like C-terminal specificity domain-containing protein [Candidatus Gracilibacteria bacterium]